MSEFRADLDFALHIDFEAILKNPILDIAARLWEEERYEAFRVCYRSMRIIDDIVDNRKSRGDRISDSEIAALSNQMRSWLESVQSGRISDEFGLQFAETLKEFAIPLWPWERLCRAMVYDLRHDGFASFLTFARYAEGAAVSPAAIFMHLCGVKRTESGYSRPTYDIRLAARPLALFSYLVHIMRDFEVDQRNNLDYFADWIMHDCGIRREDLRTIAMTNKPTAAFRQLMARYRAIGEFYRAKARAQVDATLPLLAPRYQLSLEMIYSLYLQIFDRINPETGEFSAGALNPEPQELRAQIERTIDHFRPVSPVT